MNKIDYIEFWTTDTKSFGKFVHDLFGWYVDNPEEHDEYLHFRYQQEEKPVEGGIHKVKEAVTGTRTMAYVEVSDVKAVAEKVEKLGGKILYGPQDLGGVRWIMNVASPDGTPIGVWSHP